MMQVQTFIKQNGIKALAETPLFIKIREYPEQNVYVLNYDQIESPKSHPITMECRSLIVNKDGDILSRSFDRFFNYGEVPEYYTDFDLNRSIIFTKEDGSLIKLWFCESTDRWEISTRSLAFAEGDHVMGGTFRSWVLKALKMTEDDFQYCMNARASKNFTYICEYCGPENRVVTIYKDSKIILLAIRNNQDGSYVDDLSCSDVVNSLGLEIVKSWELSSYEQIQEACKNLENLGEGFVCYDPISGKRAKIKSPLYVQIHHLRDNGVLSFKRLHLMVLMNEQKEYQTYFNDCDHLISQAENNIKNCKKYLEEKMNEVCKIEFQKDFALSIQNFLGKSILFSARKNNISATEAFNLLDFERQFQMLELCGFISNE